ncbi:ABC transporter ATP-binding protein [Methylocystis parvus]|uniref:ABC transporter ATP-binding protein n=1 Tax=Methylocystis parvus TaxID=134 RepID=A0A6B8M6Z1_9HYPH|nr:ABC transporter ATP-binding protein [Methylocystis parvus]QGM98135.1 ABC transporter ATP-binding protein [Methylocystis parvus]WBK01543.1 ABC transporter ATP-binding protein [Methylocystis parvus OBBP]
MREATKANLTARDITFSRGERRILDGVGLSISQGETVALLGPNGAGKSTLFRILLGLMKPDGGCIALNESDIANLGRRELARQIAYVPQGHVTPFPYLVADVILLGRLPHNGIFVEPNAKDRRVAHDVAAQLGLTPLLSRPYTEISGGERQLVLLARAIAQEAQFLVLDEPLTGLDFGFQIRVLRLLRHLADDGRGILFSTHHPEHALQIANRAAVLKDARVIADAPARSVITTEMIEKLYGVTLPAPIDWPLCLRDEQIVAELQR